MRTYFEKNEIEVRINEVDYEGSEYSDLIKFLGSQPPCLFYGNIGNLTYPFSLILVITIPKTGNPSWSYEWTPDEDDGDINLADCKGELA